jgi:hypothetical protein
LLSDRWDNEERKSFDGDAIKKVEVEFDKAVKTGLIILVTERRN